MQVLSPSQNRSTRCLCQRPAIRVLVRPPTVLMCARDPHSSCGSQSTGLLRNAESQAPKPPTLDFQDPVPPSPHVNICRRSAHRAAQVGLRFAVLPPQFPRGLGLQVCTTVVGFCSLVFEKSCPSLSKANHCPLTQPNFNPG